MEKQKTKGENTARHKPPPIRIDFNTFITEKRKRLTCLHKRKSPRMFAIQGLLYSVELEGIEPSSKRGNHTLSTCLSLPSVFECRQDQSHQPAPYPLKFHKSRGARLMLFPILLCRFAKRFGTRAFERHLVSATLAEIKLIYCTSIKQREHSFRCQIIF